MAEAATQQKDGGSGGMWITLLAILMGTFVAILNNSLINVALPTLVNVFGSTTDTIQWVLTGYMLANAVVIPMSGSLGDKFGYKRVFLISLIAFTASSVLCAMAWSDTSMIAFRIIQGLSGGLIMPIGMSMIYMIVPREKIGMALGLFGIASMVAPAVGPTLGGYLIQYLNWHFLFLVSVPVGIFAIIMSSALLKETEKKPDLKFDYPGAILSIIAFGTLLLALSKGQSEGWSSFFIVSLFFIAFSSLALFVWVELGKEQPLLDLSLFKIPVFTLSVITSSFVMMGMMGGIFMMPIFLQNIQGMSAMDSGLLLMPQSIAMAIMMPISGKLFDKYGIGPIALVGLTVMGITTFELHNLEADTPHHWLNTILTIRGLGIGLCMMTLSTVGMNAVPRMIVGKASSLSNVIRQVMSSFGIALLTMVMTTRTNFHSATISESITITSTAAADFIRGLTGMFTQAGVDAATAQGGASSVLMGMIIKEATVRGIADAMLISSIPIFCSIPLIYFLHKKPKKQGAAEEKQKAAA
ncbi:MULTISPECIES: DHA2 family efflux MFS transporter permease subunit [Brevibacillus]|jgi:EmrB/QacA subfamily drug resistance transporter|uniref:Multidrug resistance protein n=1 Tax=Brevibacillus borstelensis AK1 TaxID=1300222 RepID=M8ECB0_9BACL|nr:DHA2 family efflux MFS transporter permease subunit [Brevibacillus borstelensis]EMT53100.1 multidrug resistance protein [Brevibacillus borstelensis AK1]MBE5397525.1 DHA2 family efflux MFS transporter permease subunit [Brevibacillus borstelensis]MCC0564935.1 DHA2 family efflux MFS transporter permease subunit [Brevibacillus borstelensis]MCM3469165.1 DHA2 family efflux MFS transporter permease subunit [Brevibacillus borstelensis]MCM3560054.1 DHA2 family efflux MFS transporter permease subunit